MIRSALLVMLAVAVTAFMSVCALLFPLISPGENKAHKIANLWAKMLLRLTSIRVNVIGRENVLMNRPQIFMANHQSDFDILIVLAHIPGQFRWIVKKELFKIPIFGKAMKSAGYIEIDRQNHEKAMKSLEEAAQKIREGKSVMTFPEGTRSKDGTIKPFKQGMFHLAIQAGVPIVPISIIGAHEILPKRSLKIKPGRITMVIGRPVDVSGYTIETRSELIERVRGIIIRNFENGRASGETSPAPDRGKEAPVTLMEAIILGIVQGLTEPLPVSSSAHLVIVPALIPGFHQPGVAFDVLLHLGTLLAVVFFLRREIGELLASLMPGKAQDDPCAGDGCRGESRQPQDGFVDHDRHLPDGRHRHPVQGPDRAPFRIGGDDGLHAFHHGDPAVPVGPGENERKTEGRDEPRRTGSSWASFRRSPSSRGSPVRGPRSPSGSSADWSGRRRQGSPFCCPFRRSAAPSS